MKILELAKKLKALAEKGYGGEKENAQTMLQNLLAKHNISLSQIEEEERRKQFFDIQAKQHKLFVQVAISILGDVQFYARTDKRTGLAVECTKAEYIEISASFDFYWAAYEKEMELFFRAFVYKNQLVPPDAAVVNKPSNMSPEERFKILQMMEGIDKHKIHKQLTK